ncbi:ATP-dependent nuclease [Pseudomonas iridis]|uniref:ATP-dependent nuclease n=1 Tax=Pseudomonas iridis TaxID=2710587 RepID=UPI0037F348F3
MVCIRKVEIRNFRSIQTLDWFPLLGVNCLIGPGDSGKSTILDSIDLCLGARRTIPVSDTDFFMMDVTQTVQISVTLGTLPDDLKNVNTYGNYLRAFNLQTGEIEEEPRQGWETILTLNLSISSDLEPVWSLKSQRAEQLGQERSIAWKDRASIAPARLGNYVASSLSWTRGSVLNRLAEERPNLGAELVGAAREARASFGNQAGAQLGETLRIVTETATSLGVPTGGNTQALLDAHSVSIGDGAIALHDARGVPLRSLGTGSVRLLIAGLQRAAAESASIVLVDEVEYGLEPHRLTRLLNSLGAKEPIAPLQVFMTTHSPVVVRELSGHQIFVVRSEQLGHQVRQVGVANDVQSTIRLDPEAFLAKTIIVCEGASEVGFIRGLDEYRVSLGLTSLLASGVAYVNAGGGHPDLSFSRGLALLNLGYRVIVLVDNDIPPTPTTVQQFTSSGGRHVIWETGRALEDELFLSLDDEAVGLLLQRACELADSEMVDAHIRTKSNGAMTLENICNQALIDGYSRETRTCLGLASRSGKNSWFKSVTKFEGVARDIVGPALQRSHQPFQLQIQNLFQWAHNA